MTPEEIDAIARQELAQEMGGLQQPQQRQAMPQMPSFDANEIDRIARLELQQEMQQPQREANVPEGYVAVNPLSANTPLTPSERVAGMFNSIGQGATFGLLDEGVAGLRSTLGSIRRGIGMEGKYADYDTELAAVRHEQARFNKERPAADVVGQVTGALTTPGAAVKKGAGVVANMGRMALSGGLQGAAYGFGTGEGGLENRVENAKDVGTIGAVASPLVAGAGQVLSKGLAKTGDEFERMALNIQRSDLQKADKFVKPAKGEVPKLIQALNNSRERGLLTGDRSAGGLVSKNDKMIQEAADEANTLLKAADAGQTNVVIPATSNADAFIAKNPAQARQLREQLSMRMDDLNKEWDGTVSGLNRYKQSMYGISYDTQGGLSKQLDRALARDFKEAVEQQAEQFGGKDVAAKLAALNKRMGDNITLKPLLQKGVYQDEMPGGAAKALRRAVVSPLGGGGLAIGGGILAGHPGLAALGYLGAAATTRRGQFALSDLSRKSAGLIEALGRTGSRATPAIAATMSGRPQQSAQGTPTNQTPILQPQQGSGRIVGQLPTQQRGGAQDTKTSVSFSSDDPLVKALNQFSTIMPKNSGKLNDSDPLLKALIQVESGGKRYAKSPKGAEGIAQLMPATGREYHKRLGLKGKYDPYDTEQSKVIASAFLEDLKKKYSDSRVALAGYNIGETKLDAAIRKAGSDKWEDVYRYLPNESRRYPYLIEKKLGV